MGIKSYDQNNPITFFFGRYEALKSDNGYSDSDMSDRKIFKIAPNFRIAALAEPPVVGGSAQEQWLTPELLSMFLFHR